MGRLLHLLRRGPGGDAPGVHRGDAQHAAQAQPDPGDHPRHRHPPGAGARRLWTAREKQLINSIKAALTEGSPESRRLAEDDAASLQQVRLELQTTTDQLTAASKAFENAQITVEDIKQKLRQKMEESRKAITESRNASALKNAASAIAELDTYGTAATNDKYLEEIKQRSAEAKAAVEVATGGLDVERIKNERKARSLQAQSVLSEFEVEMGLKKPDAVREAAPFPTATATPTGTPQKLPEAG